MSGPSSTLIFQGSLYLTLPKLPSANPRSPARRSITHNSKSKKSSMLNLSSTYSILFLDGRLECYQSEPSSSRSRHDSPQKPIHTIYLDPSINWSLSVSTNYSNTASSYSFTISRNPAQTASPTHSPTSHLTHLGLDINGPGPPSRSPILENTPNDRKSLKQIFSFRPKRSTTDAILTTPTSKPLTIHHDKTHPSNSDLSESPTIQDLPLSPDLARLKGSSPFGSKIRSTTSISSFHPSIHPNNLPCSITFSTQSDLSRCRWIDAFATVFHSLSDLKSFSKPRPHQRNLENRPTLASTRSISSDSEIISLTSFLAQPKPPSLSSQSQPTRIPLSPIRTSSSSSSAVAALSAKLDRSVSLNSLVQSQNVARSSNEPFPSIHQTHYISPSATMASSPVENLTHVDKLCFDPSSSSAGPLAPSSSSFPQYCSSPSISLPHLDPLKNPSSSEPRLTEAVPAWIKAVRLSDERKTEADGFTSQVSFQTRLDAAVKPRAPLLDDWSSRKSSLDQAVRPHPILPGPSSCLMSHSFSAPAPVTNPTDYRHRSSVDHPKTVQPNSTKTLGQSVVQNLKRAGSLTEWPDFSHPGQSILQRMREGDNQSAISDSLLTSSPIINRELNDGSDPGSGLNKRSWLLNMVKKGNHPMINDRFSNPSNSSLPSGAYTPSLTSTMGPSNRSVRQGIYMLKGLSSTSSIGSSSHHFPGSSSHDSDGQHSVHQALTTQGTTDSELGAHHHQQPESQKSSLPQLLPGLRTSKSKMVFSEWLTTPSSQIANHRPSQRRSPASFTTSHSKCQSLSSSRTMMNHESSHPHVGRAGSSSSSISSLNSQKLEPRFNTRGFGLNIINHGLVTTTCSPGSRSLNQGRSSTEASSSYMAGRTAEFNQVAVDRSCSTTPNSDGPRSPSPPLSRENTTDFKSLKDLNRSYFNPTDGKRTPSRKTTTESCNGDDARSFYDEERSPDVARVNTSMIGKPLNWRERQIATSKVIIGSLLSTNKISIQAHGGEEVDGSLKIHNSNGLNETSNDRLNYHQETCSLKDSLEQRTAESTQDTVNVNVGMSTPASLSLSSPSFHLDDKAKTFSGIPVSNNNRLRAKKLSNGLYHPSHPVATPSLPVPPGRRKNRLLCGPIGVGGLTGNSNRPDDCSSTRFNNECHSLTAPVPVPCIQSDAVFDPTAEPINRSQANEMGQTQTSKDQNSHDLQNTNGLNLDHLNHPTLPRNRMKINGSKSFTFGIEGEFGQQPC